MELKKLPELTPYRSIERPLSMMEYYFASIGRSPWSQEGDCEIITIIEGESRVTRDEWEAALAQVVAANPACRARIIGKRQHSRWSSDGAATQLRYVENCDWDGRSGVGAEFIKAARFDLENGPTSELIIVPGKPDRVMIRAHHAVMDGMGIVYFFQELFRALRGEPLLGTNAIFSDADLMQSVSSHPPPQLKGRPASLTGGVRKTEVGNVWRRITAHGVRPNYFLGKLAIWIKQFAQRYSALPVRILLPVNLRRHCDGLCSMMNFTGLIIVDLAATDGADDFRRKLRDLLKSNAETTYLPFIEHFKWLPMTWIDWFGAKFARHKNTKDTIGLSNFGVVKPDQYSSEKFSAQSMFALPAFDGNAFIIIAIMGETAEISVGMPLGLASDGRFDEFTTFLEEQLRQVEQ
jgi:NRPS condensation-like uncharacterized protein